jgi:hypothetical protein
VPQVVGIPLSDRLPPADGQRDHHEFGPRERASETARACDRETENQRDREPERQRDRHTESARDRETERPRAREKERERGGEPERELDGERQNARARARERLTPSTLVQMGRGDTESVRDVSNLPGIALPGAIVACNADY